MRAYHGDQNFSRSNRTSSYYSDKVYGARSNHLSSFDYLPSKRSPNDYMTTSSYSPSSYQFTSNTSYSRNYSNNNRNTDIVRPATRDREVRIGNSSIDRQGRSRERNGFLKRNDSLNRISPQTHLRRRSSSINSGFLDKYETRNGSHITADHPPYKDNYKVTERTPSPPKSSEKDMSYGRPNRKDSSYHNSLKSTRSHSNGRSKSYPYSSSNIGNGSVRNSVRSPDLGLPGGNVGLRNIGNTCFMNSILQCLSNTKPLRDYCLSKKYVNDINTKSSMKGNLFNAFSNLIKELWKSSSTAVNPTEFKSQIQKFSPRFMGYEQQDCQEFLRFLLEGLHEDVNKVKNKSREPAPECKDMRPKQKAREIWKWYSKKDNSFIFDLFVGQLESSLECKECGHISLTYDPFWDLSLPISKNSYEQSSIDECLRAFTKDEILDRDEKPNCERCKCRRRMNKKLLIHKFPKILVLHLKRFNEGSRYRQKLSNYVKFPLEKLQLSEYATKDCEDSSSTVYDLCAVSNHCGSCYGGHYTAYCKNPTSQKWNEYNDSRVSSQSSTMVVTKEAYVLFYVQRSHESNSRL